MQTNMNQSQSMTNTTKRPIFAGHYYGELADAWKIEGKYEEEIIVAFIHQNRANEHTIGAMARDVRMFLTACARRADKTKLNNWSPLMRGIANIENDEDILCAFAENIHRCYS